ncbi:peroxisomal leader peptide-processing protease [Ornithorhynchus anatinus]|uniref:peroxisomal leader peptide-processing protease n=1 Tax=Ornithorhynchus anatinus TaxID=9258 RepID=UPI0010A82A95|nr:peroxisomal leader peptide-processing protease [Ornithorhynchus anatinus]
MSVAAERASANGGRGRAGERPMACVGAAGPGGGDGGGAMGAEREASPWVSCALSAGCVVSASGPGVPWSCSGVALSARPGLVLCHGGALASRLPRPPPPGAFVPAARLRLAREPELRVRRGPGPAVPARLLGLLRCPAFAAPAARLLRAGDVRASAPEAAAGLFALVRVGAGAGAGGAARAVGAPPPRGSPLLVCACPFGGRRDGLFLNTLSAGVLCNRRGPLLLGDARCLPGAEGGGVWDGRRPGRLVALVAAPLHGPDGPLGLALLCAARPLLRAALRGPGLDGPDARALRALLPPASPPSPPSPPAWARAVLVDAGSAWGSGLGWGRRLVVTCRHVVAHGHPVRVKPQRPKGLVIQARVVFATQDTCPYDVAVLQLEEDLPEIPEPILADRFHKGEEVNVVGFGVFGQACGPSVTAGILSAVVTVDDEPVMLQTTCAVHRGSSGGPVFSTNSGQLLGIVASNTRDNSTGTTYPHLNFSIPITVLQPALREYIRTGDPGSLDRLNRADEQVRRVWRLQKAAASRPRSRL